MHAGPLAYDERHVSVCSHVPPAVHLLVGSALQAPASLPQAPVDVPEPLLVLLLSPGARVFAFVWGLLWGSFSNVLIFRLPRGMSIVKPRSACSSCGEPVRAWDNIPVLSYLLLRGRCRHCKEPYSIRYLVVELLFGVLSFALYMQYVHVPLLEGGGANLVGWLLWFVFGGALLVITYIDLDFWIIPDAIVLPLAVVGVACAAIDPSILGVDWAQALIAGVTGYGLFAGIRWFYLRFRNIEGLGLGDAKLLLMVGAFTGIPGLIWTIGAGALQGVIVSVPLLLTGKSIANTDLEDIHGDDPELGEDDPDRVMGQRVPFGPFLALAALEYILLRSSIEQWTHALLY